MTIDTSQQQTRSQAIEEAMQQAIAQHRAGQLQLAGKLYRAILQLEPNHPEANHNMGVLSVQMKQPTAGLPHFVAALEADPTRRQYWLSYIDALYQAGQLDEARQVLAIARQQGLDGNEIDSLLKLLEKPSEVKAAGGQKEAPSIPHQKNINIRTKPGKPAGHQGKEPLPQEKTAIVTLFNQGRYAEVATLASAMTQRFPRYGFGWKVLGVALKRMEKNADALAPMQKAIELLPDDAEAYSNLGANLQDLGRSSEAEDVLKRALKINPNDAGVLCNLGITLQSQGRLAEAEDSYRQALRIRPDFPEVHGSLGAILQAMGRLDESLAHFQQRAKLMPGDAVDQHLIASLSGKNTERAPAQYVEKVFDNYADKFDTHLQQGLQYEVPGKLLALLKPHVPKAEKWDVLDLGCGTGLAGVEIAPFAKRLVGVDLSAKMLEQARARNLYQRLEQADLVPMMRGEPASSFEVIVAADVFVYLGKLDDVFAEVKRLLGADGIFAFSVEDCDVSPNQSAVPGDEPDYQLKSTGRYGQSLRYLDRLATANGLKMQERVAAQIRSDNGKPIKGHICICKVGADMPQPTAPLDADRLLLQAVALHQAGKLQEAEKQYSAILQIDRAHSRANHNMGALLLQLERPAASLPYFVAALESEPTSAQYWLSYIDALYQAGQVDDARQMLALARQQGLEGDEVEALARLVGSGAASHQPVAKVSKPAKAEVRRGNEPSPQERNRIVAMFNEGRHEEVAALARTITERFPKNGFGWNVLGAVLKQMGRSADALAPMQKAAALSPGDSNAHCNLGATLQDLGRSAEAEASLRRALKINPDNAEALCNLGYALQSLGRLDEAEASYRRALRIKPDFAVAHCNLGMTLHNQGRLDEAEASYRKALQLNPGFAEAHCNLGITLQSLGRPEAEASFRRALEINPDYVDAHSSLGVFLQETGRLEEALEHFRECARLSPGNVVAQHLIASLTGHSTERAPDQYVEKVFDNYADRFDTHLQQVLQYDIPKKLVPLIAAHLAAGAKCNVLDLGCGTGLIGPEIAPYAKQLVGVDLSAKMLDKARTRNLYRRLERSDLLGMMQGEPASSYDLVIAADVFVYVGKLDEIAVEIKRLLTAGGIFAFSTETCAAGAAGPGYQLEHTGRYAHSVEYLSRLAASNGFRVLEMVATQIRTEHGKPVSGHMAVWQVGTNMPTGLSE
ncbi:MAG: tetratricopeptide repeat protein [Sideroxyarcus sp.]